MVVGRIHGCVSRTTQRRRSPAVDQIATGVLSGSRTPPASQRSPAIRCLFVTWKDGTASQFSVPDTYTLQGRDLLRRRRPRQLEVFDTTVRQEMYLELKQIRSCYVVDVGPDQRIVET